MTDRPQATAILELVQAMNRAKASGRTDDDEALLDSFTAMATRYQTLIAAELSRDFEIGQVIKIQMMALAVSIVRNTDSLREALDGGLSIGAGLIDEIGRSWSLKEQER